MMRYRVTAPYVTVRCTGSLVPATAGRVSGYTILGFYRDSPLPDGAHPDDVQRLFEQGAIAEVPAEHTDDR